MEKRVIDERRRRQIFLPSIIAQMTSMSAPDIEKS
jgi:hypothetical protein